MQKLLASIMSSPWVLILLAIFTVMFAIIGMQLLGGKFCGTDQQSLPPSDNSKLPWATIVGFPWSNASDTNTSTGATSILSSSTLLTTTSWLSTTVMPMDGNNVTDFPTATTNTTVAAEATTGFYVSASVGTGKIWDPDAPCAGRPRFHFDQFGYATLASFVILTGDSWDNILLNAMQGVGAGIAVIFCLYYFIGAHLLLALFTGILLAAKSEDNKKDDAIDAVIAPIRHETEPSSKLASAIDATIQLAKMFTTTTETDEAVDAYLSRSAIAFESRNDEEQRKRAPSMGGFLTVDMDDVEADEVDPMDDDDDDDEWISSDDDTAAFGAVHRKRNPTLRKTGPDAAATAAPASAAAASNGLATPLVEAAAPTGPVDKKKRAEEKRAQRKAERERRRKALQEKKKAEKTDSFISASYQEGRLERIQKRIQQFFRPVLSHWAYNVVSAVVVCISCVGMAMEDPIAAPDTTLATAVNVIDTMVKVVYVVDSILNIIVWGFIMEKSSYLRRNFWNVFDFILALVSAVALILKPLYPRANTFLSTILALRPLSLVKGNPPMRLVVRSLGSAIFELRFLGAAILLTVFMVAIIGVQLLSGKMRQCVIKSTMLPDWTLSRDNCTWGGMPPPNTTAMVRTTTTNRFMTTWAPTTIPTFPNVTNLTFPPLPTYPPWLPQELYPGPELTDSPINSTAVVGEWKNLIANFDNVLEALFTLFVVSTLELWSSVMLRAMDYSSPNMPPVPNANAAISLYFVAFAVIGGFLLTGLFMSVLVSSYNRCKRSVGAQRSLLTQREQNGWESTNKRILRVLPADAKLELVEFDGLVGDALGNLDKAWASTTSTLKLDRGVKGLRSIATTVREYIRTAVEHRYWSWAVILLTFTNFIVMIIDYYPSPAGYTEQLSTVSDVYTWLFVFEAVFKVVGEGPAGYMASNWNRLDFFIVLVSLVGFFFKSLINVRMISFFRAFRTLRLTRLLQGRSSLGELLRKFGMALLTLGPVAAVIMIVVFMFAVLGKALFGRVRWVYSGPMYDTIGPNSNFSSLGIALMIIYRITFGGNWMNLCHSIAPLPGINCDDQLGDCGPNYTITRIYFVFVIIFCALVLKNLLVAVLVDSFASASDIRGIRKQHAKMLVTAWRQYDPDLTMRVRGFDVLPIIRSLPPMCPLGFRSMSQGRRVGFELRLLFMLRIRNPHDEGEHGVRFVDLVDLLCHFAYLAPAPEQRFFKKKLPTDVDDEDARLSATLIMVNEVAKRIIRQRRQKRAEMLAAKERALMQQRREAMGSDDGLQPQELLPEFDDDDDDDEDTKAILERMRARGKSGRSEHPTHGGGGGGGASSSSLDVPTFDSEDDDADGDDDRDGDDDDDRPAAEERKKPKRKATMAEMFFINPLQRVMSLGKELMPSKEVMKGLLDGVVGKDSNSGGGGGGGEFDSDDDDDVLGDAEDERRRVVQEAARRKVEQQEEMVAEQEMRRAHSGTMLRGGSLVMKHRNSSAYQPPRVVQVPVFDDDDDDDDFVVVDHDTEMTELTSRQSVPALPPITAFVNGSVGPVTHRRRPRSPSVDSNSTEAYFSRVHASAKDFVAPPPAPDVERDGDVSLHETMLINKMMKEI